MSKMAGWIQTYTGKCVDPLNVDPQQVRIGDIAHSLSLQCRFAGHCKEFYSVAEHCVRVSVQLQLTYRHDVKLLMLGLMHDAAEAYLPDIPSPLKQFVRVKDEALAEAEGRALHNIFAALGLDWAQDVGTGTWSAVKHADLVMLATEARDLMGECDGRWIALPAPHPACIAPMSWREARSAFVSRYRELWQLLQTTNGKPGGWDEQYAKTAYPNGWEDAT